MKTFTLTASAVFSLIAVAHAARMLFGWEVVAQGWTVPQTVSLFFVLLGGGMAAWGLKTSRCGGCGCGSTCGKEN